jgi:hypothetical protein
MKPGYQADTVADAYDSGVVGQLLDPLPILGYAMLSCPIVNDA